MLQQELQQELQHLQAQQNHRTLPNLIHYGHQVTLYGDPMLNLSSNDYLGLASDRTLRAEFLRTLTPESFLPSASSSRLLTGNYTAFRRIEKQLAALFRTQSALLFNSGYHANTGILPAVSNAGTLILADKLVHASLIDGIRLSAAKCIRYRHNDLAQLQRLLETYHTQHSRIIIVTESIFSMDGDEADLCALVSLKQHYPNLLLYVDEAHAFGVRGKRGLGCAEEHNCIREIDFLVGTFGKAAASTGAYLVCTETIRNYLINRMRTFIYTTALPPINVEWTSFILQHLPRMQDRREHLHRISSTLRTALIARGHTCPSTSHILPLLVGTSADTLRQAEHLQHKGFYALPVRPPSVPEGTSRIRFSLTADLTESHIQSLIQTIYTL